MKRCTQCYSYAINTHMGDRKGDNQHTDLCDVCYWKAKYLVAQGRLDELETYVKTLPTLNK